MKKIFLISLTLLLSSCASNSPSLYKNYCQKDYWGDSNFNIFGRKNCVGDTGKWVDENHDHGGYYCLTPRCENKDNLTCKDTCDFS